MVFYEICESALFFRTPMVQKYGDVLAEMPGRRGVEFLRGSSEGTLGFAGFGVEGGLVADAVGDCGVVAVIAS